MDALLHRKCWRNMGRNICRGTSCNPCSKDVSPELPHDPRTWPFCFNTSSLHGAFAGDLTLDWGQFGLSPLDVFGPPPCLRPSIFYFSEFFYLVVGLYW